MGNALGAAATEAVAPAGVENAQSAIGTTAGVAIAANGLLSDFSEGNRAKECFDCRLVPSCQGKFFEREAIVSLAEI